MYKLVYLALPIGLYTNIHRYHPARKELCHNASVMHQRKARTVSYTYVYPIHNNAERSEHKNTRRIHVHGAKGRSGYNP